MQKDEFTKSILKDVNNFYQDSLGSELLSIDEVFEDVTDSMTVRCRWSDENLKQFWHDFNLLVDYGLLKVDGDVVEITDGGKDFYRLVVANLKYLPASLLEENFD